MTNGSVKTSSTPESIKYLWTRHFAEKSAKDILRRFCSLLCIDQRGGWFADQKRSSRHYLSRFRLEAPKAVERFAHHALRTYCLRLVHLLNGCRQTKNRGFRERETAENEDVDVVGMKNDGT